MSEKCCNNNHNNNGNNNSDNPDGGKNYTIYELKPLCRLRGNKLYKGYLIVLLKNCPT